MLFTAFTCRPMIRAAAASETDSGGGATGRFGAGRDRVLDTDMV
jgi:hypothetical protein